MNLYELNQWFGSQIGLTLLDASALASLVIRLLLNTTVVGVISRCFYYPKSLRRDYMFIFIIMSMSIFMLVSFMGSDSLQTGAALGLFAIFGIIRYRTEAIPIREMTYLFMLVSISVINALSRAEYHPKTDYWEGLGLVTIVLANLLFIGLAALFESSRLLNEHCSKYIKYDNVDLVSPDKRQELIADLEKRTGLTILSVEVGTIDFLKDSVMLRIYYDLEMDKGSSIQNVGNISKIR